MVSVVVLEVLGKKLHMWHLERGVTWSHWSL